MSVALHEHKQQFKRSGPFMKIFRIDLKQKGGFEMKDMPFLLMSPGIRKGKNTVISQRMGEHAFCFLLLLLAFLSNACP